MSNEEADREFVKEASTLAFDVAERGLKAVVDYMNTSFRVADSSDAKRSDIERAMTLAADGVKGARRAVAATRSDEQKNLENATVDFVRAVTPRVIGAAARIVTGKDSLSDDAPRDNVVRILQEVGSMITSLLNDSVGGAPMRSGLPVTGAPGPEVIRLGVDKGVEYVGFRLENIGLTAVEEGELELRATPLIGDRHVILTPTVEPPGAIAVQSGVVVQLHLVDDSVPVGTYRGHVYALWRDEPVALGEVELTVREPRSELTVPVRASTAPEDAGT
jgi:hypothetical protein